MSSFSKTIKEIIYVAGLDEEELRRGFRAFGHTSYGHNMKDHLKKYLTEKGIEYGILNDAMLSHIPGGHSSFHEDENGNHHIHSH